MIIWRGFGWVGAVVILAAMVLTQYGVDAVIGLDGFYTANAWPKYLAAGVATVLVGATGLVLNSKDNTHTLFFIPLQYWVFVLPIIFVAVHFLGS